MALKKGLGRGFDSLIPSQLLDEALDPTAEQDSRVSNYRHISIDKIMPDPQQPRRHFDEESLEEMAASIKVHGVFQPLVVTANDESTFIIVAGERRWRAAQRAGLDELPVIVRSLSDQHKLEIALIENLQRKDLNRLEEATAYLKLAQQFSLKNDEIARRVGKAVSTVSNIIRLLNLPDSAKTAFLEKKISEGHARQILAINDPKKQDELLELIIKNDWSVRKAEQFVIGLKESLMTDKPVPNRTSSETRETKQLSSRLAAPVTIKSMAKGGQLIIRYQSDEDLERIYGQLL